VASLEEDNLVIYYYFSASEIRSDKRGSIWWEGPYYKRGQLYIIGDLSNVLTDLQNCLKIEKRTKMKVK